MQTERDDNGNVVRHASTAVLQAVKVLAFDVLSCRYIEDNTLHSIHHFIVPWLEAGLYRNHRRVLLLGNPETPGTLLLCCGIAKTTVSPSLEADFPVSNAA